MNTEPNRQSSGLKLPKINLPCFNDKYSDWTPFFDHFKGTIDGNSSLSLIQNLQYLKASLKDEPAKLLAHIPTTSANYEVAVQLLKQRYANKRIISFTHMDALFEFMSLQQESAEQLRKLLNVYLENKMALDSMSVETSDSIWVYTIAKKMDSETRRYWELYSPGDELQTMDQMKTFLEERTRALEAA